MGSALKQRTRKTNFAISDYCSGNEALASRRKIRLLQELVTSLQRELESLNQAPDQAIEQGLDFYEEVSHFEIEIIKRALRFAAGHQGKAAQLLKLKANTLNAMIKRYYIQLGPLVAPTQKNSIQAAKRPAQILKDTTRKSRTPPAKRLGSAKKHGDLSPHESQLSS